MSRMFSNTVVFIWIGHVWWEYLLEVLAFTSRWNLIGNKKGNKKTKVLFYTVKVCFFPLLLLSHQIANITYFDQVGRNNVFLFTGFERHHQKSYGSSILSSRGLGKYKHKK